MKFTRVTNNANGNPRYVVHFLELLTDNEMDQFHKEHGMNAISFAYNFACHRAKRLGGKRFHNKQFGGGIVFVSFETSELESEINKLKA